MANSTGYSWGTAEGGEWLTILGSHWAPPVLTDHPEEAKRPHPSANVLARVERCYHPGVASGRAFRILHIERTEEAT